MSTNFPYNGWVVVNKPLEKTSTQMVGAVKRAFGLKKVGHAGTLDPLATGVVPIALGEATKTVSFAQDFEKVYECRITWGRQTTTDDAEGETLHESDKRPSLDDIEKALDDMLGMIEQIPPQFSAVKIQGKRAYDLARAGETVEIKTRHVRIDAIEILDHDKDWVDLRIECGKGTYIRSIARDLGQKFGCYGYITKLERRSVGPFLIEDAISLDILEKYAKKPELEDYLLPMEVALDDIPAFPLNGDEISTIKHGGFIKLVSRQDFDRLEQLDVETNNPNEEIILYGYNSRNNSPIALLRKIGPEIRPYKVFNI